MQASAKDVVKIVSLVLLNQIWKLILMKTSTESFFIAQKQLFNFDMI